MHILIITKAIMSLRLQVTLIATRLNLLISRVSEETYGRRQ